MARPIRLEFPGAIYHIYARGNRQEYIFLDDEDRILFLELLAANVSRLNWLCHSYCLMGNHYHLLIETPDGILSRGMQSTNSVYAKRFNKKYEQVGHVFQGRFSARLVHGDQNLLLTARYVNRNPIDAHLVEDAGKWLWSSYRAIVGECRPPEFLLIDQILNCMSMDRSKAQEFFKVLVHTEIGKGGEGLFELIQAHGDGYFLSRKLAPILDMKQSVSPVLRKQRILSRPSLNELFSGVDMFNQKKRNPIIKDAFRFHGYRQTEIGNFLGLDRSTICKIISKTN